MTSEEKTNGMLCHLLALSMLVGIPFGNIIGPMVIWLIKKNESPFVDDNGKSALNFQITYLIALFAVGLLLALTYVLTMALGLGGGFAGIDGSIGMYISIGVFILLYAVLAVLGLLNIVMIVIGSVKANDGEVFKYPMSIRFIK